MLTCVHHPIDAMRVVEEDEANRLKDSGLWFDCPRKAQAYREKVEKEIKDEAQNIEPQKDKPKRKPK